MNRRMGSNVGGCGCAGVCERKTTTTPSSPSLNQHTYTDTDNPLHINPNDMKIDKYVFHYHHANVKYATKYGAPRSLNPTESFILYAIRHLTTPRLATILQHARDCSYDVSEVWINKSIQFLMQCNFIERNGYIYSVSHIGKDYLYSVRRYLLHKRL